MQPLPPPLSPPTAERLRDVRLRLLDLHKVLLEDTKAAYELDRGRIATNSTLLQLVINDPWFAWLRPLSETVVRIDVMLLPDAAATKKRRRWRCSSRSSAFCRRPRGSSRSRGAIPKRCSASRRSSWRTPMCAAS